MRNSVAGATSQALPAGCLPLAPDQAEPSGLSPELSASACKIQTQQQRKARSDSLSIRLLLGEQRSDSGNALKLRVLTPPCIASWAVLTPAFHPTMLMSLRCTDSPFLLSWCFILPRHPHPIHSWKEKRSPVPAGPEIREVQRWWLYHQSHPETKGPSSPVSCLQKHPGEDASTWQSLISQPSPSTRCQMPFLNSTASRVC